MSVPEHAEVVVDVVNSLNKNEPGQLFWVCVTNMSAAECAKEANSLLRHLRQIPRNDYDERAECLACIAHVRMRQAAIALRESAKAQEKCERRKRCYARKRAKYEARRATKTP
jgi:hypothetical protein